jgi:hypothetical protein
VVVFVAVAAMKDDTFAIKWVPAFAGTTGGGEIGFVSSLFFDAFENKGEFLPEKRFRNETPAFFSQPLPLHASGL